MIKKNKGIRVAYLVMGLGLLSSLGLATLDGEGHGVPRLTEVGSGIYRGAQPTEEGYRHLKSLGVKTIVNFRHEKKWIDFGRDQAKQNGMQYVSLPWLIFKPLQSETVDQFFTRISNSENRPLFYHCKRGVERTGAFTFLYLIRQEKLTAEEARRKAFEGYPQLLVWKPFVKARLRQIKENFVPH